MGTGQYTRVQVFTLTARATAGVNPIVTVDLADSDGSAQSLSGHRRVTVAGDVDGGVAVRLRGQGYEDHPCTCFSVLL